MNADVAGLSPAIRGTFAHEIGVFVETQAHAIRLDAGRRAGLPEQKMAVGSQTSDSMVSSIPRKHAPDSFS
jgi:hypothetical protein